MEAGVLFLHSFERTDQEFIEQALKIEEKTFGRC